MSLFIQCADSVLDYVIDWDQWLEESDVISSSIWAADSPLTIQRETNTENRAVAFISGGEVNREYTVVNTIVTTGGRTHCQEIIIRIE